MPKYEVELRYTRTYTEVATHLVEVEADDEDSAETSAWTLFEDPPERVFWELDDSSTELSEVIVTCEIEEHEP